jgi:hypothetical protein
MQQRGTFRGFEILSKGKSGGFGTVHEDERIPHLLVRGRSMYSANLNATNPVGTVQSIEHALRNMDKLAAEQRSRVARIEKELADYQSQADRPFEHEERLKQLLTRQSDLNAFLDLDKGDQQGADSAPDLKNEPDMERNAPAVSPGHHELAKMAEAYMRAAGTAIREMPITERPAPQTGLVSGRAVAKNESHIAVATAANTFVVLEAGSLGRVVQVGERLSVRFREGHTSIDNERNRGR